MKLTNIPIMKKVTVIDNIATGALVRHLREKQGRSLVEVATAAGISHVHLFELERGNRTFNPDHATAIRNALAKKP